MQGASLTSSVKKNESAGTNGVIQCVCEMIFKEVPNIEASEEDSRFTVSASYLEIYNETLIDLLVGTKGMKSPRTGSLNQGSPKLTIREDTNGSTSVSGLSQVEVKSPEECYGLLIEGADRRTVGSTKMNCESSRSHALFTISLMKHDSKKGKIVHPAFISWI